MRQELRDTIDEVADSQRSILGPVQRFEAQIAECLSAEGRDELKRFLAARGIQSEIYPRVPLRSLSGANSCAARKRRRKHPGLLSPVSSAFTWAGPVLKIFSPSVERTYG
jgi:hypothetical protein